VRVREIRQCPSVRLAPFGERLGRHQHRRHDAAADEKNAHDERGRCQQFFGVANAASRIIRRVARIAADQRHHGDAGFESRQTQCELWKKQQRHEHHRDRPAVLRCRRRVPPIDWSRRLRDQIQLVRDQHHIETDIDANDRDGESHRFPESFQEHGAKRGQQEKSDQHRMIHPVRRHRVFDDVRGGIRGRQRDGDDESRRGETEKAQDERFAAPAGEQLFEDLDAPLSMRAELGDAVVHRQCAE
jgi:hypothetical protein